MVKRVPWSDDELQILKDKYPDNRTVDILPFLVGRSYCGVSGKAKLMGLKKSDSFFLSELSGRTNGQHSQKTWFKKGDKAWNKGVKLKDYLSEGSMLKMSKTQFKKGVRPHNYKPIGSTRMSVDGYLEVKVRDCEDSTNNYELMQRVVWERANGPIPKRHVVTFKDGNRLNCEIDNLEMISLRENMLRNNFSDKSIVKRFFLIKDEEIVEKFIKENSALIEAKRKILLLNQKIKKNKC